MKGTVKNKHCLIIVSILFSVLLISCETLNSIQDHLTTGTDSSGESISSESADLTARNELLIRMEREGWSLDELDTARNVDYLTENEKDVILVTNAVRTNPSKFAELYVKEVLSYYSDGLVQYPYDPHPYQTHEGIAAVHELLSVLMETQPLEALFPSKGLSLSADDHSADQSATGEIGHTGSDGSSPSVRIGRYGRAFSSGENISYGHTNGLRIVLQLLIDDNVPSRGHRESILNKGFELSGVSINTHKIYGHACVITYATWYNEHTDSSQDSEELWLRMEREGWPLDELDTARNVDYLTENEKDVILAINAVRTNPSKFAELYVREILPYFRDDLVWYPDEPRPHVAHEGTAAVYELLSVLMETEPLEALLPSKGLSRSADGYAGDSALLLDRINRYGKHEYFSVSISSGRTNGLGIVLQLLIDDGSPARDSRKIVLTENFEFSGVSIDTHETYRYLCTIIYAAGYSENIVQ